MSLLAFGSAATIALATTAVFLVVVRCWDAVGARLPASRRFADNIMKEAAQRYRDKLARLGRQQSQYLVSALVLALVFGIVWLFPPSGLLDDQPRWQLLTAVSLFSLAAALVLFRIITIAIASRRLAYVRDANLAVGHALQKLADNRNRVFHDVRCGGQVIDHVLAGLQGIYAVNVIARVPDRKQNQVSLKGDKLVFDRSKSLSVARYGDKTGVLKAELNKLVDQDVHVRTVVVVPGWEVVSQDSKDYLLVNERNLSMLAGWRSQSDFLLNEDADTIQQALTERCMRRR